MPGLPGLLVWGAAARLHQSMTHAGAGAPERPPAMATLAEADGGVLLRARVERLDGMARVLAGPEWPFRIREPDELRAALRDHAAALAAQAP